MTVIGIGIGVGFGGLAALGREVPPVPPTEGQLWVIPTNGHTAIYRSGAWVAVTPTTDNVAVILGNGELILDTASVTGA